MPSVRRRSSARPKPAVSSRPLLAVLLIVAAGVATYWNSLSGPFVWDDQTSIVTNQSIREWWPPTAAMRPPAETPVTGRPLVNVTFALNYAIGGLSERGYHIANLAIHIACALLLFAIVEKGSGGVFPANQAKNPSRPLFLALGAALFWMVHPLQSEAVDYVTQRTESLMALFYLTTLYAAIRARNGSRGWELVAILACVAGMLSKESMVTAPLLVLLYDRMFGFPSLRDAVRARRRLYLGLAATWLVFAAVIWLRERSTSGLSAPVTVWMYLLNQAQMIPRYLWLTVWPRSLVLDYGLPRPLTLADALPGAVVVLAVLAATIVALVRWPRAGFLGAAFFLTLAPTSSFLPISSEVGAERRMYLPSAALAVLIVSGARRWLVRRKADSPPTVRLKADPTYVVGIVVLAALATRTVYRNAEYATPLKLWQTVVDRWPHGRARMALATEMVAEGRHTDALAELREAVRDFPDARSALGTELVAAGNNAEGVAVLREFIRADPQKVNRLPAHLIIAQALAADGKVKEASDELRALLASAPNMDSVRKQLADILMVQGRFGEAAAEYRTVLTTHPAGDIHRSLAEAYLRMNDAARGEQAARDALKLAPDDGLAHNLVGVALASRGNLGEAIAHFERALAINPNDAEARANLERAKRASGIREQGSGIGLSTGPPR